MLNMSRPIQLDRCIWAIAEAQWCIENGLEAIWVPHRAPIDRAPGHVDLEGFWARLAEAGVPFVLHPYEGLKLVVMPGVEITDDHDEFLFRLGVGYDIAAGDWVVTPALNVDFVDNEENLVFGVAFGKAF